MNNVSCLPAANGEEIPYTSLEDFIRRVPITLDQLIILIRIGAFRFTGKPKATMLWEAHMLLGKNQPVAANRPSAFNSRQLPASSQNPEPDNSTSHIPRPSSLVLRPSSFVLRPSSFVFPTASFDPSLFSVPPKKYELPALWQTRIEDVYDEIELLGWPVTHTWFDLLETSFRGEIMTDDMIRFVGKKVRMLGLLVTIKYVRTVRGEWMHFGTFIDVFGRFFDTVHFPKAVDNYPFRGDGVYLILGKIVEEFGFPSLEVEKMAKMPLKKDPRT